MEVALIRTSILHFHDLEQEHVKEKNLEQFCYISSSVMH